MLDGPTQNKSILLLHHAVWRMDVQCPKKSVIVPDNAAQNASLSDVPVGLYQWLGEKTCTNLYKGRGGIRRDAKPT